MKLKVAISTDNGKVSEHFGRCPEFTIAEIEDGKIVKKETINNPGHSTGFLPGFFAEQGVKFIIAGGAGSRAVDFCNQYGVKLILGAEGSVDKVLQQFAEGKLKGGESSCFPGLGEGYGIAKEDGHKD